MPERAEIALMSDYLNSKIMNLRCDTMVILPKSRYWKEPLYSSMPISYTSGYSNTLNSNDSNNTNSNNSNDSNNNLTKEIYRLYQISSTVRAVFSKGKKIVIEFVTPINTIFRMVSSCGMEGRWTKEPSKYTCIVLTFGEFNVYYDDITNKGLFSICNYPSPEYDHIFKDTGPDLMTEEVDINVYYTVIRNPKLAKIKIMHFMMEQKYLSGIGNYLRAEILYKARVNPHRTLNSLSDSDVYNLFYYSKVTIWEAYRGNGLTIKDYFDPNGNAGIYRCLCYGRDSDDNGFQIIKEDDGKGRKITWCPSIQI